MQIFYGIHNLRIDITECCLTKLEKNNVIIIPSGDENRATLFSDPVINVLKKIFILNNNISTEYDSKVNIKINLINNSITTENDEEINNKLIDIQSKLKIKYGTFNEELPEQIMAVTYLSGNEKVLEIGSNIGRNSLIIGYILENNNNHNFVTLESDTEISKQLRENRDLNNLHFHIENSALSKRKLIQCGWDTIESDILLDGYKSVNTITFNELILKYNINFDTLVLGADAIFNSIVNKTPTSPVVLNAYAGFIDIAMSGLSTIYRN
jgi:predicted O-methyltransferase YrrM